MEPSIWAQPRDISTHGKLIDNLISQTIVITTLLFIAVVVWLAIAYLKHGEDHKAVYDHGTSKGWMTAKVGVICLVFFGVDGNLFYNSTKDLHETIWNFKAALAKPDTIRMEVNAHQWAWDSRTPGVDGKFGTEDDIVRLNDWVVPVNTDVVIQLAAVDVLHNLYIPTLRLKTDAVPGDIRWTKFNATETGKFEIACSQHCGTNHYKMRATLTVLSKEAYADWTKQAQADAKRWYNPEDETGHWGWEWKEAN
jgi:cytochrome c oxidase subunit 2